MKTLKRIQNKIITFWKWIKQKSIFILKKIKQLFGWIKSRINATLFITLFITLIATVLGGWAVDSIIKEENFRKFRSKPFLTFESDYTQVFRLSKEVDSLEYSVGESEWQNLRTENIVFGGRCGKLLLRGNSKKGTEGATIIFGTDAKVVCTGDIYTLVDYIHFQQHYKDTTSRDTISFANFGHLFENCKQLVVAPELCSMFLADSCYNYMFSGCTSLKRAPELPADTLTKSCYEYMFSGCTALEEAPIIKAKKLAERCCSGMFMGCISLEKAPELQAKFLAKNCYSSMFKGCESLQKGPSELPADTLAEGCYKFMFENCLSLKEAPELPAMTLSENCYSSMFKNCSSLENAPKLPATELAGRCYTSMFFGCSKLKQITMLAKTISKDQFSKWLPGNTSTDTIKVFFIEKDKIGVLFKNKEATWKDRDILPDDWKSEVYEEKTGKPFYKLSKISL